MREIKFRAWIEALCHMVYSDEFETMGEFFNDIYPLQSKDALMQFTGRPDKNGKEIYEGDILRIHNPEEDDGMVENYKYTSVEFRNGAFKVEYDFGDYDMTAIGWAIDIWYEMNITCEIIGNIYENHELLTPKT